MRDATDVVAGAGAACARRQTGEVSCWGALGLAGEIMTPKDLPELRGGVELALGYGHVCGRMSSGKVICWGTDERGELGGISAVRRVLDPT